MSDLTTRATAAWNDLIDNYNRAGHDASALEVPDGTGTRSYATWMRFHNGDVVDTVQVTADTSGRLSSLFRPTGRRVDSNSHTTYATMGLSRRDYTGVQVLASDDTRVLACAPFGDRIQVFLHTAVLA